ncbi:MAG: hypothetical protein H7A47_16515 [Verrucomicrobiales bacterium]|nr:hypothetical protein [Verrucomicrobiales bacterium]
MSQRISLTRIIALGWYGFRQIFDVKDDVLISGAYGTGKSALLDLMQYVLLGEHWRANRAAAGSGAYRAGGERASRGRDLAGYCLGDTNQMRNGERHFLRQSGVTLAALEFTRPQPRGRGEATRETWGIRLEYSSPAAAPKHTYFVIPDRLDLRDIAPENRMLPDDEFRAWLRREYGNECLFARQQDYLEEMAAPRHLNFDRRAFQRTFPKAIAFEPEENVERFIREFILEESPIDVRDVRTALQAYEDTRRRLEKQEDEAGFLRRIGAQHATYAQAQREEAVLHHVGHALKALQAKERRDRHAATLQRLETEHADDLKQLEQARQQAVEIDKLLGEVRFEIEKDPDQVRFDQLDRQQRDLQARVNRLLEARKSTRERLDDRHYRWLNWLKHGAALSLDGLPEALVVDDALLATLRSGADADRQTAMQALAARFHELWTVVGDLLRPLDEAIQSAQARLRQLDEDLENLARSQEPGSFPLFHRLRQKLGERVEQLGRLIEVKPEAERWWPALELFLGRHRWVIVVNDQADYRAAIEILRQTPAGPKPESLLNPREARDFRGAALANSLFSKIEVLHPVARPYLEHLLGPVICAETSEELESGEALQAISVEGVLKQTPLRRRLRPAGSVELTLGREGLERMRAARQKEQNEVRARRQLLDQRRQDVHAWLDHGRKAGLGDATLPELASELPRLPEVESELRGVRATIDLLKTPERDARQKRLLELEQQNRATVEKVAVLNERRNQFDLKARPEREGLARAEEDVQNAALAVEDSRTGLSRMFDGILNAELDERRDTFRREFPNWQTCFDAVQQQAAQAGQAAVGAREKRNHERSLLITARDERGDLRHPEYQHDFPIDDESNEAWTSRLRVLETVELEKSRQRAADRKAEWERRLEDNVLNELNQRITDAQRTIRLLDSYLGQPIGRYRYRISQRRDTAAYGSVWALLGSGLEPTDPLMAAVPDAEVQRAKQELMAAVHAPDNSNDRARGLLDYRNYHRYDLEMVPADHADAPPISFGRSGRNLSGGENQAPFFISMLAAFRRVYDRGNRDSSRSQQLGLVVMDEAFSKLSGDGIEDCLALARNFQLQLVMAFPPERLGVMAPHAQTVVMCQKEVERDAEGYVTRIQNIPLLTTMAEAVEALS